MDNMIKVFFQGSFDLFHFGHLRALERASELGDYLIIGLNTDRLYKKYKKKIPVIPYSYRRKILEGLICVDKVVPANRFSPIRLLKNLKPDIYVICKEWKNTKAKEMEYMKSIGKTVVLPYLKTISTSNIRSKLIKNYLKHNEKQCSKCHREL